MIDSPCNAGKRENEWRKGAGEPWPPQTASSSSLLSLSSACACAGAGSALREERAGVGGEGW